MFKPAVFVLAAVCAARAEVHSMTLRQAVEMAVKQNPDVALARLDELKAQQAIRVAKDPFTPRIVAGSGLAYTNGFPMSIEGSAPSIVQASATQYIFNRPQSFAIAEAKENARGAAAATANKRDEVAYRAASLYLDAERAERLSVLARKDADSLAKILDTVHAQVEEGRALPLVEKQAALNVARARQSAGNWDDEQASAETALAVALGFPAEDRVRAVEQERPAPELPESEEHALQTALESNKELRQMQSQIIAKELEVRSEKAGRLPHVDLVAQYGLFARFNNYDKYFVAFQRNNGEIGMSFQIPLFTGPGISAQVAQSRADIARLRIQYNNSRNRVATDLQQSFRDVQKARSAAEVARLDLDVAREQVAVDLAQMQEGRLSLRQMEEARVLENNKWIALYDAQYAVQKAEWNVLRLTGGLLPSIESLP